MFIRKKKIYLFNDITAYLDEVRNGSRIISGIFFNSTAIQYLTNNDHFIVLVFYIDAFRITFKKTLLHRPAKKFRVINENYSD